MPNLAKNKNITFFFRITAPFRFLQNPPILIYLRERFSIQCQINYSISRYVYDYFYELFFFWLGAFSWCFFPFSMPVRLHVLAAISVWFKLICFNWIVIGQTPPWLTYGTDIKNR